MRRIRSAPIVSIGLSAFVSSAAFAAPQSTAPFADLTDNPREFTNLNVETTRGVLWSAIDGFIYGLNTNASQVIVHADLNGTIDFRWQTVANPVALAEWQGDRILVVGGGSHSLALHDRNGGEVLATLQLPSEPADIVVDEDNKFAFVSCQGANEVVKIDLSSMTIKEHIEIPAERPRFLSIDLGDPNSADDNVVFVAPFTSGNNSIVVGEPASGLRPDQPFDQQTARVADLDSSSQPLPDEDLFEISTVASPTTPLPAFRRAGTLLAAHGRHPNGSYWMCNVESRNKISALNNEPLLNGQFALNRISIGTPNSGASPLPQPTAFDIDNITPTSTPTYNAATSLAFPFGIAFHSTGIVVVSASMSDRIGVFDPSGARIQPYDIQLAPGSIPRHLQFDPVIEYLLVVHCWGKNVLQVFAPGSSTPVATLDLGVDPAPKPVQQGREIWYDADRSLHGRTSCNTCHPGGKTDFLAWSISDPPHDHKDAMVTQSLLSIEDTFPYHWRGERDLLAFNGAFTGLLGGTQKLTTTGTDPEFPKLQAFIFSLQAHANPFEVVTREVSSAVGIPPGGSLSTNAVNGQTHYINTLSFASRSCNDCHALPTTTNSDFNLTDVSFVPSQTTVEVAHLREMRHRDRNGVAVAVPGIPGTRIVSSTGVGLTHEGTIINLFSAMNNFALTQQQKDDVAAYVRQLDNGLSPAAHAVVTLSVGATGGSSSIGNDLIPQVKAGWIDLVAFADHHASGGATTSVRWRCEPSMGNFACNDPTLFPTPLSLAALVAQISSTGPIQNITFVGVPPGNGNRFAFDPDFDGLNDALEPTVAARWTPDTDNDTWPDGYEVLNGSSPTSGASIPVDTTPPTIAGSGVGGAFVPDFITTSVAKFFATTSEDATVEVTFQAPPLPARVYRSSNGFGRVHTIVLQGLEGSTPAITRNYTASFTAIDRQGNRTPVAPTANFTSAMVLDSPAGGIGQPTFLARSFTKPIATTTPQGDLIVTNATITIEARDFGGSPTTPNLAGRTIAAQVLIRRAGSTTWNVSNNFTSTNTVVPSFNVFGVLIAALAGSPTPLPFLILPGQYVLSSPTTAGGVATLSFSQPGLQTGDEVVLRLRAFLEPDVTFPATAFDDLSLGGYQMPATQPEMREIRYTF